MVADPGTALMGSSRRSQCPICGSGAESVIETKFDPTRVDSQSFASRKKPERMNWSMAECAVCDLLFAVDPPDSGQLRDAYKAASFDASRESEAAAVTYMQVLDRLVVQAAQRPIGSLSVLDVGCGDGAFLQHLLSAGAPRIAGIEISDEPVRRAPPDVRAVIESCLVEEYSGGPFELATAFQVWEHFSDPVLAFSALGRSLAPDGYVMGVVHDRRSPVNRLLGRRSPIWDIEHLQLFSPRSVRALVARSGYRLIALRHITNAYPLEYWLRLSPIPERVRPVLERLATPGGRTLTVPLRVGNLAFLAQRLPDRR